MRKQRDEDNLQHESDQEPSAPRLIVAVGGNKREILCNYENAEFVFQEDYNTSAANMFNQLANKKNYDLFCYMGHDYNVVDEHSISKLVNWIWNSDRLGVSAVYTDLIVKHNNIEKCIKIHQSYSFLMYQEKHVMNTPFIVKAKIVPTFNENISYLYLWDGLLDLMRRSILSHLPEPLFTVDNTMNMPDLTGDMEQINKRYYE